MVRGKELSTNQRAQITALRGQGLSLARIAGIIGCSKTTVHNTIRNFQTRGTHTLAPRPGRPRKWTARHERSVLRETLRSPFLSWRQLSAALGSVPSIAVRRIAYRNGIRRRIALRKPFLTAKHRTNRLSWARTNQSTDWKRVLFTDESTIERGERPGRTWVSRRPGTANLIQHMAPTFRSGRLSISVWAGIAYGIKTPLFVLPLQPRTWNAGLGKWDPAERLNAARYGEWILDGELKKVVLEARTAGIELTVVEDGAPAHTAASTRVYRDRYAIQSLIHPACSPDLNPIDNVWALLKHRLAKVHPLPWNQQELGEAAVRAWNDIPMDEVNACIESMPKRVLEVLTKRGAPTRY